MQKGYRQPLGPAARRLVDKAYAFAFCLGKRLLDARTTRALSCTRLIAEIFILRNPMTGSMDYLTAATALTGVWVAALVVTLFTGRLVKSNK